VEVWVSTYYTQRTWTKVWWFLLVLTHNKDGRVVCMGVETEMYTRLWVCVWCIVSDVFGVLCSLWVSCDWLFWVV